MDLIKMYWLLVIIGLPLVIMLVTDSLTTSLSTMFLIVLVFFILNLILNKNYLHEGFKNKTILEENIEVKNLEDNKRISNNKVKTFKRNRVNLLKSKGDRVNENSSDDEDANASTVSSNSQLETVSNSTTENSSVDESKSGNDSGENSVKENSVKENDDSVTESSEEISGSEDESDVTDSESEKAVPVAIAVNKNRVTFKKRGVATVAGTLTNPLSKKGGVATLPSKNKSRSKNKSKLEESLHRKKQRTGLSNIPSENLLYVDIAQLRLKNQQLKSKIKEYRHRDQDHNQLVKKTFQDHLNTATTTKATKAKTKNKRFQPEQTGGNQLRAIDNYRYNNNINDDSSSDWSVRFDPTSKFR